MNNVLTYKRLSAFNNGLFTDLVLLPKRSKASTNFFVTNMHGIVQVLSRSGQTVKVMFLDTGVIADYNIHNVSAGKCKDPTRKKVGKPMTDFNPDKVYCNASGARYVITNRLGYSCTVKFLETGKERTVNIHNARTNKVTDYFHKASYGVGYLGELGSTPDCTLKHKLEYTLWRNMLKRCYCESDNKGYFGRNILVNERWYNFSNFVEDLPSLQNYDLWLKGQLDKKETQYNLDKDFAFYGCNEYSKETCQFINESLNKGTTINTLDAKYRIDSYVLEKENNVK